MDAGIIIAIITAGCALLGSVIGSVKANKIAVYRIDQLERKVDKHNNLVERMYHAEEEIALNRNDINAAAHRIIELENK